MNKSTWLWDVAVKSNGATTAFLFQPLQRHDSRSQGADIPFIHLGRINARTIPKRKTMQETNDLRDLLCEDDYASYQPLLSGWDHPVSKRENKQKHITSYYIIITRNLLFSKVTHRFVWETPQIPYFIILSVWAARFFRSLLGFWTHMDQPKHHTVDYRSH